MDDGHIIAGLLENTVAKYPDYPAVRWIVKKQIPEKSYRELNEDRNKIAGALLKNGFEGKQVAMIGTSSYEWIGESSAQRSRLCLLIPCSRLWNSVI